MSHKFWRWVCNEVPDEFGSSRILHLEGQISDETWWGDEVTPKAFKDELHSGEGDITIWINSPGGDCFAAAQIYNMLREYPGMVTVKVDGLAASAASVVAMAGNKVCMSPVGMLMIHNPATMAYGDVADLEKAIGMLNEVKESIINAYELKSTLPRKDIAKMMSNETWLNAKKAVELGFADEILFADNAQTTDLVAPTAMLYSPVTVMNSLLQKVKPMKSQVQSVESNNDKEMQVLPHQSMDGGEKKVAVSDLQSRLDLLIH